MHPTVDAVTRRIIERSQSRRKRYLTLMEKSARDGAQREVLSCGNLVHGFAASPAADKDRLKGYQAPNVGIVTAYNDMLSAHAPYKTYPDQIKVAVAEMGATAQVAGGVPAMCDGVTQGQPGMELSLFSRDQIALSTAIALSHNMFDAVTCLGICDKIVPGLLIGALRFGHLPVLFIPAGPMATGLPNSEKQRVRKQYRAGEVGYEALLEAESKSYHSQGTCTFYGTANSNQMLMEMMGLQLPGSSFVHPQDEIRPLLTAAAARIAARSTKLSIEYQPLAEVVTEKALVNAVAGLLATGGSTNHTLHLVAIARAAGIELQWQDIAELSEVVPLLARVYPNGDADVNQFHGAGGMALIVQQLLQAELVHDDVKTVAGPGLERYAREPQLDGEALTWKPVNPQTRDPGIIAPAGQPFQASGGIKVLQGNLGQAVIKISAVPEADWVVEAPARIFHSQAALEAAFSAGELDGDMVAVVRFQGPRANGMPELHKLTPTLAVLQDRGFKVALVTDGRMSGASGKIPAAIHVTPEAYAGGPIAKLRDGDLVRLDARDSSLEVLVDAGQWQAREAVVDDERETAGLGRELFASMRERVSSADTGATLFTEL
ncbi:phosphogluconate dehydratase [Exilibacterium tricleocarpae]|uniref:Phosphogluconate dehydratase n=1 Tax=Exilibacterium tricleocarpae TaxID=2591008 RepID=A0A545U6Z5_9GAMM|nr:phosphogluconate dehydratase [Exilibacterium tricleocarpae]TQV85249.1 phosphogluconate dehydratase [Exilibacterium tricleocarpae]